MIHLLLGPARAGSSRFLLSIWFILAFGAQCASAQNALPAPFTQFSFPAPESLAQAAPLDTIAPKSSSSLLSASSYPNAGVSWKTLPIHTLRDQKYVWLFPLDVARGHHLVPTISIVGVTAALIALDSHTEPYFARTTDFDRYTETFNGTFTGSFMAAVPVSLYVFGLARHDSYAQQTAILAGEAYADSAIPHVAIKVISRRYRPSAIPPNGNFSDTFFQSSTSVFGKGSSFPSGHAAGVFSIATVIARRYGDHRWVPWVAYGVAGVFAFSRVPSRSHFPSDVFLGAALGYTITRYDVFRGQ